MSIIFNIKHNTYPPLDGITSIDKNQSNNMVKQEGNHFNQSFYLNKWYYSAILFLKYFLSINRNFYSCEPY